MLQGATTIDSTTFGLVSIAGKFLVDGDVTVRNSGIGLWVTEKGTLRVRGPTNTLENNFFGVRVEGGYLQLEDAAWGVGGTENSLQDVDMLFGAKALFTRSATTKVSCDDPSRVLFKTDNVACPP